MKIAFFSLKYYINKSAIPGSVITIQNNSIIKPYDMTFESKTQNSAGKNIIEKNIYCGDFLSFDYVSRNIPSLSEGLSIPKDKKVVYNPLIIFAGYDPTKKLIYGVDLRKFKVSGLNSEAQQIFRIMKNYYYNIKFNSDGSEILEKKPFSLIMQNPQFIFTYQNLSNGIFSKFFPILKNFYRSYNILFIKNCITFNIEKINEFYNQTVKLLPGVLKE